MKQSTKDMCISLMAALCIFVGIRLLTPSSHGPTKPQATQPAAPTENSEPSEDTTSNKPLIETQSHAKRLRHVRSLWFDVSTYTPSSDGYKWGKRFASVNFLEGGKHYELGKPYRREWTRVADSLASGERVCAVPKWCEWLHTERIEYPSGEWGHKYILRVPFPDGSSRWYWPRDRITKYHRLDLLENISNREAMKRGVRKNVQVEVYEYLPDMEWE